ncbi:MAG: hypothetical protein M3364_09790 [Actinomycetota bacterium]|nr:hypothetical protein [Actinomycetota bacterium]
MKALFVLPFARFDAPPWLHRALQARALATIVGRCACGAEYARNELRPGEVYTPPMLHEHACPAVDPRLEGASVLPDWIELHAIGVELPDEAAA